MVQRPHWHIDYLRPCAPLEEAWYTNDPRPREHEWAGLFSRSTGASLPFDGFGASDCRCRSHLFRFDRKPSLSNFGDRLRRVAPDHGAVEVMRFAVRSGSSTICKKVRPVAVA
ncbi:MAG: DUF123 domain-containing protein, partial [Burkholderiales bacterium]|nr:DUF123 domain-containing protein [Burkholderiales bacterium]